MKDAIGPRGIINGNPVFVMLLGLCPALAITTSVINAWTMGLAVIFVLVASGTVVSLLRTQLPASLSPYSEMVVIAVFVTVVELALARLSPARTEALGIYLPLIAVNCIILNQAKGSARRKTPGRAVTDALSVGVGFFLSLTLIALVREVIGRGSITLVPVGSFSGVVRLGSSPARVVVSSSGAFLVV